MNSSIKSVIKIQKGNEYHVLVDNPKNMYDESMFFYPVYKKSVQLLQEMCTYSKDNGNTVVFFSNNLIMYCAERGGGKSSAMRSFANVLERFEAEKEKENFSKLFPPEMESFKFSVLKIIDPTAISSKDLFIRIILSRMFSALRSKLDKEDRDLLYQGENKSGSLVSKFTECYRLLDVIYQKGGEFSCEYDLEELTDLGDSCRLREIFRDLVQDYLRVFIGDEKCENNFLVIQIDDADLNSNMAFNIIEDIRKYCIVPNVVILMAVNMDQMRCVIEQYFVKAFKSLLDLDSIRLSDCQKMAARYIDKIMPAGHQIHLPTIDNYIQNRSSELTIEYCDKDGSNLLCYTGANKEKLTDYQEILLRLIYERTGIPLVKANGYLHNILPKTMRGLSHFLAYICPLDNLNQDYGVSEINVLCNSAHDAKIYSEKTAKTVEDAKIELAKRKGNLDAFEQYFLKNWCPVRLSQDHRHAIEDIATTVSEQKISSATKWLEKLFKNPISTSITDISIKPALSPLSYSYLLEMLRKIGNQAYGTDDADETYRFTYAIKFYFTLFFNRLFLLGIEEKGDFDRLLKASNLEVWEPRFENIFERMDAFSPNLFMRFEVNYNVLNKVVMQGGVATIDELINKNCIIRVSEKNYFAHSYNLHLLRNNYTKEPQNAASIVYDFGALLLSYVCDVNLSVIKNNEFEDLIACSNYLFMLLLNWDIQRCAEKAEFDSSNNDSSSTVIKYIIDRVSKKLNDCLTYLPVTWNLMAISSEIGDDLKKILLFSVNTCCDFVNVLINTISGEIEKAGRTTNQPEYISFIMSSDLTSCNKDIKQLSLLSGFSESIKHIVEKWNNLYEPFENKFGEDDLKRAEYLEKQGETLLKTYNDWKFYVGKINFDTIKKDIEKAFKNKKM